MKKVNIDYIKASANAIKNSSIKTNVFYCLYDR